MSEPMAPTQGQITTAVETLRAGGGISGTEGGNPVVDDSVFHGFQAAHALLGPDYEYQLHMAAVAHTPVDEMAVNQLRTYLTAMAREDYWMNGSLAKHIRSGRLVAALERALTFLDERG